MFARNYILLLSVLMRLRKHYSHNNLDNKELSMC